MRQKNINKIRNIKNTALQLRLVNLARARKNKPAVDTISDTDSVFDNCSVFDDSSVFDTGSVRDDMSPISEDEIMLNTIDENDNIIIQETITDTNTDTHDSLIATTLDIPNDTNLTDKCNKERQLYIQYLELLVKLSKQKSH